MKTNEVKKNNILKNDQIKLLINDNVNYFYCVLFLWQLTVEYLHMHCVSISE